MFMAAVSSDIWVRAPEAKTSRDEFRETVVWCEVAPTRPKTFDNGSQLNRGARTTVPSSHQCFGFNETIINVLAVSAAGELVAPATVGAPGGGPRHVFSIEVDDVDAVVAELAAHGVTLLNGPIDRPWGLRTASFADPAGHVWEIAQSLRGSN